MCSRRHPALLLLIGATALLAACANGEASPLPQRTGAGNGVYLALGDSFTQGWGASTPDYTYVSDVQRALANLGAPLQVQNLAQIGAGTQSLVDTQLPPAEAAIQQGGVRLITVAIGGNDMGVLYDDPSCRAGPADGCPVDQALEPARLRLHLIFQRLRAVAPKTPIVVMTYPDAFSGTGDPREGAAAGLLARLNSDIRDLAPRYHLLVADAAPLFRGRGLELTHLGDPSPDAHPNDAGYRVLAQAVIRAVFGGAGAWLARLA